MILRRCFVLRRFYFQHVKTSDTSEHQNTYVKVFLRKRLNWDPRYFCVLYNFCVLRFCRKPPEGRDPARAYGISAPVLKRRVEWKNKGKNNPQILDVVGPTYALYTPLYQIRFCQTWEKNSFLGICNSRQDLALPNRAVVTNKISKLDCVPLCQLIFEINAISIASKFREKKKIL